jgi:hypothetical protein
MMMIPEHLECCCGLNWLLDLTPNFLACHLQDMVPVLERVHHAMDIKSRLESIVQDAKYAKALEMCSECMLLLEECPELSAIQEMHQSMEARHYIFFLQLHCYFTTFCCWGTC